MYLAPIDVHNTFDPSREGRVEQSPPPSASKALIREASGGKFKLKVEKIQTAVTRARHFRSRSEAAREFRRV